MNDTTKAWLKDTAERMFWTFIQGATAILTVHQLGWLELGDGELWKAAAAGGVGGVFSLLKAVAATRLGARSTAQLGTKTYSYTEAGPGSAGGDLEGGQVNLGTVVTILLIVVLVLLAVRLA